jgi:hypothetical protein
MRCRCYWPQPVHGNEEGTKLFCLCGGEIERPFERPDSDLDHSRVVKAEELFQEELLRWIGWRRG